MRLSMSFRRCFAIDHPCGFWQCSHTGNGDFAPHRTHAIGTGDGCAVVEIVVIAGIRTLRR